MNILHTAYTGALFDVATVITNFLTLRKMVKDNKEALGLL